MVNYIFLFSSLLCFNFYMSPSPMFYLYYFLSQDEKASLINCCYCHHQFAASSKLGPESWPCWGRDKAKLGDSVIVKCISVRVSSMLASTYTLINYFFTMHWRGVKCSRSLARDLSLACLPFHHQCISKVNHVPFFLILAISVFFFISFSLFC